MLTPAAEENPTLSIYSLVVPLISTCEDADASDSVKVPPEKLK
jgi:hypothetical protein